VVTRTSPEEDSPSGIERGEAIVQRIQCALDWAKASMASAQEDQQRSANRTRQTSPLYRVGDKVWLNLEHFRTTRVNKKLDWRNAKYTITELIGSHAVRLNTPPGPHNVFHVDKLRLASEDGFPSQQNDDMQPEPITIDGELEYEIEEIVNESYVANARKPYQYEVKWKGYAKTTWEPAKEVEETIALDNWIRCTAPLRNARGRLQ